MSVIWLFLQYIFFKCFKIIKKDKATKIINYHTGDYSTGMLHTRYTNIFLLRECEIIIITNP